MKKILIKFPASKADEISTLMGENELFNLSSWSESRGLFGDGVDIYMWVGYAESKVDRVEAKLQKYYSQPKS
jgi:hypothetical protein